MNKKLLYMLILLPLFLVALLGCEPVDEEIYDNIMYPDKEWTMIDSTVSKPVEIKFWIPNSATSSMGEAVTSLANLYNQEQSLKFPGKNITVVPEFQGTSGALNTKLQAAILSNNNPVLSAVGVSSVPLYQERTIDLRTVLTYDEIKELNQGLLQYSLYPR